MNDEWQDFFLTHAISDRNLREEVMRTFCSVDGFEDTCKFVEPWKRCLTKTQIWNMVRDHVKHEDELTEQRIYNMMTFQAAIAVVATVIGYLGISEFLFVPVIIALLHAVSSTVMLTFSKNSGRKWVRRWTAYAISNHCLLKFPDVIGERRAVRVSLGDWLGWLLDRDWQFLFPILFAIGWGVVLVALVVSPPTDKPLVVHVDKGDAIVTVADSELTFVRLVNISCPSPEQPFGDDARQYTKRLCWKKSVELVGDETDATGTRLADVIVNGKSLCEELLSAGLAWHDTRSSSDPKLARLQAEAKTAKRGLWAEDDAIPPWN
ncbi:MAG: thermonuclease family protein [Planctomycetales bacterium]|nr:thermonuclease family protein [Planctomycetales bacterium]